MMSFIAKPLFLLYISLVANAYWLTGAENILTTQRLDPIVSPGKVASHVHAVVGGSNFGSVSSAVLRQSQCTSMPIPQDKSNYWFPLLYFQWSNGSFTSVNGGVVVYYLFSDPAGNTTAFPDDFRMISGESTLRTYDASSFAQQAVTFLCLDFNGVSTRHNELPSTECPSGIRSQINFPSCWDGVNVDSPDHKSHVAFLSGGPDSGSCSNPKFPVTLPRVFMEVYWSSGDFDAYRSQAMNPTQPFVFSNGDPTGYGYHADFVNGWDTGVLQNAVNNCHCNIYGDATCCVQAGIFGLNKGQTCRITPTVDEQVLGTLPKLPGNNPVQQGGQNAVIYPPTSTPPLISPVYAYTGPTPTATGNVVSQASTIPVPASPGNANNVPAPSPSASPASSASIHSNQVPAPSMPTLSKPSTTPSQASGHGANVSVSHTHASYTPVVTHTTSQDELCDGGDSYVASCDHESCNAGHHSTTAKHHHVPTSVASHKHCHTAGGHGATPSTDCSHPAPTHHTSGPGKKRTPRTQERRSHAQHVARSPHNAGHRLLKYHARTF